MSDEARKLKRDADPQEVKKPPGGQGGFDLEKHSQLATSWKHYNP
jgi:hypothetical protein